MVGTQLDKYDTYIAATITIEMLKQSKQNALNYTIHVYKQLSIAKKYTFHEALRVTTKCTRMLTSCCSTAPYIVALYHDYYLTKALQNSYIHRFFTKRMLSYCLCCLYYLSHKFKIIK